MSGSSQRREQDQETLAAKVRVGLGILLVIGSVGFLIYNLRWLGSALSGPVPLTLTELRKIDDPAKLSNPWVKFTYEQSINTGVELVSKSRRGNETRTSKYLLVKVEDRWLITEVKADHQGKTVTGYLDKGSTPLRAEALDKVKAAQPDKAKLLLPFYVDGEYGYGEEAMYMVGVLGFLGVLGLVFTLWGMMSLSGGGSRRPRRRNRADDDNFE
jgi:hypothetical protein